MDFVAIDFETANEQRSSACQLGAVVFRGGEIVEKHCWWIRPRPMRFSSGCIAVHGIRPERVANEPDFAGHWPEIREVLENQCLVAHNARFDLCVLLACLQNHRIEVPEFQFTCTRAVARQVWPNQPGYGLRVIADRLGITFRHHDGLEDATACGQILLTAASVYGETSLESLEKRLRISRGQAGAWGCGGPRNLDNGSTYSSGWSRSSHRARHSNQRSVVYQQRLPLRSSQRVSSEQIDRWVEACESGRSLENRSVCFTGLLTQIERKDAERLAIAAGGTLSATVTRRTSLLVVGAPDARTLRAGRTISTKQERAEQLKNDGQEIEIISEAKWLERLVSDLDAQTSANKSGAYTQQDA